MNRYEKSVLFKQNLIRAFCGALVGGNLLVPLYNDSVYKFSVFQLLMCFAYVYGMLAGTGIICRNTHEIKGDMELYEQNTSPLILMVFFFRCAEAGYYLAFSKAEFNWKMFGIIIILDVLYVGFILIDKSNYGYAKEIKEL